MLVAVANGVLRETTYGIIMSELHAHQLSTIFAAIFFAVAVAFLSHVAVPSSPSEAIKIGAIWLFFTLCFEFLFGRFVAGHSWSRLFQDYDLFSGRVWLILLAWVACLPYLAYRLRGAAI